MNIQIFGTSKCFDTKKAQRYFKERGVKFQMIDLKEKEMSRGEFDNVARALGGWEKLVNPTATFGPCWRTEPAAALRGFASSGCSSSARSALSCANTSCDI